MYSDRCNEPHDWEHAKKVLFKSAIEAFKANMDYLREEQALIDQKRDQAIRNLAASLIELGYMHQLTAEGWECIMRNAIT